MPAKMKPLDILPSRELWNLIWAPMRFRVLQTAFRAGVFDALAGKSLSAALLASAVGANAKAMRMVADELAALGFLKKKGSVYSLSAESAVFLVRKSPFCIQMAGEFSEKMSEGWLRLGEALKSGRSLAAVNDPKVGAEFFEHLVSQIFPTSFASGSALSRMVKLPAKSELHILDVAAGSGAWSLPFALKYPRARVTASDIGLVLKVTRRYAEKFGVADRYDYLDGNIRNVDFGREKYDLIVLGHICHSEGAEWSKRLIAKSAAALKPGGILAIPDMIANDARTGPEFPLLFAINMLLHTSEGDTFTISEYRKWMTSTGLEKIMQLDTRKTGCDIVIGRKPVRPKGNRKASARSSR